MSEAEALSRAICDVYDAALDPSLWTKALESACTFIGGSSAALFWHDAATEDSAVLYLYNDDPYYSRLYFEKYVHLNPVFPAAAFIEPGLVTTTNDLVPQAELVETRFYREWVAPQGIVDALAAVIERDATTAAFLNIRSTEKEGVFDAEARRRAALIVPHFQRAVAIGRLFDQHRAVEAALTETLHHVDAGVFLVGPQAQVVFANALGQTMLEDGKLLTKRKDALAAVLPEADRILQTCIGAGGGGPDGRDVAVALSAGTKVRWFANVLPLTSGARQRTGSTHNAVAAVFVRKRVAETPSLLESLAKRYELTACEIRVMDGLLKASGVKAIAALLGVSPATVKTHLQHIFRKTATGRQSDLVKLVAGMSGPEDNRDAGGGPQCAPRVVRPIR